VESGTTWSSLIFMRVAGIRHSAPSRSNSLHSVNRNSPGLTKVSGSNRSAYSAEASPPYHQSPALGRIDDGWTIAFADGGYGRSDRALRGWSPPVFFSWVRHSKASAAYAATRGPAPGRCPPGRLFWLSARQRTPSCETPIPLPAVPPYIDAMAAQQHQDDYAAAAPLNKPRRGGICSAHSAKAACTSSNEVPSPGLRTDGAWSA
jgi:hypothetical protein